MSEYANAGVDYAKIGPFKAAMQKVSRRTHVFSLRRGVHVQSHAHGALFETDSSVVGPVSFAQTTEGLGNKNWIAEWLYQNDGTKWPAYGPIARDTMLMAINDLVACGAMPFMWLDEVAAGDSEWFADEVRAASFAEGCVALAWDLGVSIPAGESPALRYLVRAEAPVKSAPVLSGTATGILAGDFKRIAGVAHPGDAIIGFASSGVHANGISLIIKKAMERKEAFLEQLPNKVSIGEAVLEPTRSYVELVEALARKHCYVRKFLPGTGGGVAKLAASGTSYTYRINVWPKQPQVFDFLEHVYGISRFDMLTTFNCGIGYYAFAPQSYAETIIGIANAAGYEGWVLGVVEEGPRQVIFGPAGDLVLPPPAD